MEPNADALNPEDLNLPQAEPEPGEPAPAIDSPAPSPEPAPPAPAAQPPTPRPRPEPSGIDMRPGFGAPMEEESEEVRIEGLLNVTLELAVEVGRSKMTMRDVLDLQNGSIVELDRMAGDMVDILINGHPMAKGEIVVVDDKFGVRLTRILATGVLPSDLT